MAFFNEVILIGNLTRDPELRRTPNNVAVCDICVAINRKYNTGDGQERDEVCFIDIVVWAKQAESCNKYLNKGASVFVEGRLKNDNWEDKEGNKRTRLRVIAERVQFLTLKPSGSGDYSRRQGGQVHHHDRDRNNDRNNMNFNSSINSSNYSNNDIDNVIEKSDISTNIDMAETDTVTKLENNSI